MTVRVSAFDFLKHGSNVGGRVGVTAGRSKDVQLLPGGSTRRFAPRLPQGLSNPLRHGHLLQARYALNLSQFHVVDQDLQSCAHCMSMSDSYK